MFDCLGRARIGMDDFRRNGLLLPSREDVAARMLLPLHRGPHRQYNEMVLDRLGGIERRWVRGKGQWSRRAAVAALERLGRLQRRLAAELLDHRRPIRLNRHCRLGLGTDFTALDALADQLWETTDQSTQRR